MPTFTNYNNYIKAKGNSSICCASKDNCIGNANNLTNYANLYGDDVNISISDNANSEYAIISLNPEIFVNKITVSNETLVFRDSSNKELTLGYKSIDNSYSLFFPSQIPSTLSDNSNNKFALTTNNSGELSWFQPSLNSIDSSINFLYNNLSNAAGITIRNEVTYVTNSNYDNNNLSVYGSGLKFTNNNFATTISFEDISNNLLINQTRFLINGQTNETENGIYLCNSLVSDNSFTLIRTSDLAYGYNAKNIYTFVTSLNQGWLQDSCDNDIIIGTNDITFKKFSEFDISLTEINNGSNINVHENNQIFTINLNNDISISTITISHELLLTSDCSLVFATDSSSIAIQGPSDSSGYTLTLPTKIPDNDPNANYYLRSDASGNLEFFDLSNIQVDISLISLDPNLIIDISNFGDISGYIFDLCNNLNVSTLSVSTLSVSHELLLKSDCSLVFATDSSSIAIQGPSDSSGYTLTLPTKIPDNDPNANYYLRSDPSGNLEFFDLSNIQADISLISLNPNLIIDISNFGDISGYTFDLCNNLNVSTLSVSQELLLKSDCSLVFATDSSSIAIQGPSDSSGYTLTLPTKIPDNDPNANYYLRSDPSGNLEFFDLSDIQVDISLISLDPNLIIDISNFGDISGYIFDLCNNLNVSTLSVSHELLLKSDCSLVFATDSSSIAIQGPSDSSGYTLTLPTKIPDDDLNANYYLRSDASGNLEFFDLSNIQADISLISLNPNLIIDISNFGDISGYTFDLCNNFNVSTLSVSTLSVSHELLLKSDCSLVFATDSSSIAIQGPSDSSGYTLTLPTKIPDNDPNANYYLRSDPSGNLEFFDLSNIQADISLISLNPNLIIDISNFGDISGYTFDLCNNLNVSTLSVSHELLLKSDCSLVFATDSSSIAIQGPSDSSGYTLTLPTKIPDNDPSANYYLGSDASGNLEFKVDDLVQNTQAILKTPLVEFGGDNLGDQTLFTNFYNIIQNNPVIASNQNSIEQVMKYLVYFDTRQRISQGIPINYYLPSNTFNSSRNTSDGYVNYDLYEYVTYKSTINYINEKNLLHAVNFKPKYLLNFMSIETIVTNYIDSYYSSINKPLLNSFSNDFYLKVLNLITVLKNSNIDDISNNPIYTLNKDIYNLIDTINKHPITKDFSFNEMPCICPINLNPPYYYRSETQTGNVTIITDTPNTISIDDGPDINLNKLMIFGDIEYEQNFVAIKEAQRNAKTRVPNSSANIFMYFYCQNTNNNYDEFDLLFDMTNTDNNNNLFSSHYNNNKQITDFIKDNSQVCLYDYGNIMFALDNSFNYDNSSNMDYILIPPLTQLNTIRDQINSAGNLSFAHSDTINITLEDSSFNENYIDNIIPNNEISDISGFNCSLSSQLKFVNCVSNNLHTIDLSYINNNILNSDISKNILILCPIRENQYILQTNTDSTRVESSTQNIIDASFEDSINRYFIIPQYFNSYFKSTDVSFTLNTIVSTNQSDTINYLLYSEKAGSKMDNNDLSYNVFAGDYNQNKSIYMKYKYSYFYLTFYDIPNQIFSHHKVEFNDTKISKIVANSVNTYNTSNLLSSILINNLNSIEIDNTLLDYSNRESSIYNDYNSIDQINIIYMLYLLYESSHDISNDLMNIVRQNSSSGEDLSIYDFYRAMRKNNLMENNFDLSNPIDSSNLELIDGICKGDIRLRREGFELLSSNLNASFFELSSNDIAFDGSFNGYTIDSIKDYKLWNYRLTLLLLYFSSNISDGAATFELISKKLANSIGIKGKTYDSTTFNILNYQHIADNNKIVINDPTTRYYPDIQLTLNKRYKLHQLWSHTYSEPFQYLTITTS